ncbi:conserved Plasmodium protein, unknown function [Plasmodium vivax]|uniref:Uncharacterized protein n=1 Tax=Plasmodium vivax TaxID=5855 RepID=A0A1G4GVB2_PLAVI|nr:conserved Plasmodium protein, unknown function [Plasmodium vivax]
MMFNENSTNSQGVVNKKCMPKGDCSSSSGTPGGLYKWGEEDHTKLMQNTLYMFDHIKNDKHIFSKIIKNVITFLNKLKEENRYYEFLFSYTTFVKKYGPLTDYTSFKKVIERINRLDIIEVCISFNFNNDSIFQTLLSSYLELHLNEANNVYNVLLELTSVVIDGYAIWGEQKKSDSDFVEIFISQCELKYVSREQINKWFSYVRQHEDNYSDVLFCLIDFCLSLIDHVHALLAEGAVACATYAAYVSELAVLRRSSPNSAAVHRRQQAEVQSGKRTPDQRGEEVRRKSTQLGRHSPNDVTSERDAKRERPTKLTTYVKDTPGHIYICTFEDKIVCMKNGDCLEEHPDDATANEDRSKFVYEIKSRSANLYILKVLVCTILKAMKITHHLNQDSLTKLFSFFNQVLSDIIKCIYQKNDVLFLNLFFTDILKTMHVMVSFYNENIEHTPKQTMLFYKCFNKVIDQICIYLHNKTFFSEMILPSRGAPSHVGGSCLQKYAHNFKETCYMLFCLFYAILEKTNRVNNEIFLFFCCVLDVQEDEEGEGVLEPTGVTQSASESTEPHIVKSLYRTLCLNRKFLHNCREDLRGKSINRIITIFIFLEKKIKKYFFFFKYVFGFVWNRFGQGALNGERRSGHLHPLSRSDWRGARRWSQSKSPTKPPSKPPTKLQTVMKRIKYVLLDMFTKYTKLLMVYRFHFARCIDVGKGKEPFTDEFLLYMKSIECVLFSIFVYCPNGVLTKLNAYATERGKLGKLAHGGRSQFSAFNRGLYCFGEGHWGVPSGASSGTSSGTSSAGERRGGSPDDSDGHSDSVSGSGSGRGSGSSGASSPPRGRGSRCLGENSQTKREREQSHTKWVTHPCDLIVLNVLGIIYANIMEELTSHRYRYVYFKHCLVHAEFVKKLRLVLLGGELGGEADVAVRADGGSRHLACYFHFPYELLCAIIIHQLKCFSNDTLKCQSVCTAVVEFLFYISSSKNPYFFTISRRLWRVLGCQMNKYEEVLALTMLTKILFHLLCGGSREESSSRSRNERLFLKSIRNNDTQQLLLSFLSKQFFINDVGKNYVFFYGTLLGGIQSEELALGVMQVFFGTFHVHLQYTLKVLLRFLNLYERGVEVSEATNESAIEAANEAVDEVTSETANEAVDEVTNEANIISLFVYLDLVKVLPANFLSIVGGINLMREMQNTFLFFIYVNDEYRLLEERDEQNKHLLMVNTIKRTGMQYYHRSAKIYFPLVISSLISHYLFFITTDGTFRIPPRLICTFYEHFFSNRYLYTLCSNHVYMRVLSDSFVILHHLREGEAKGSQEKEGEAKEGEAKKSEAEGGLAEVTDHQWGAANDPEEDTHNSGEVKEHGVEKHTKEDASVEDAPVEDAPVEDAPMEYAPLKDAPMEDAPLKDAPMVDSPLKDAPMVDSPMEGNPPGDGCPGGDSSTQMGRLSSCLFQVYIHFLEEYATMFHAAIVKLVKNKLLWRRRSGGERPKGGSPISGVNEVDAANRLSEVDAANRLSEVDAANRLNEVGKANRVDETSFCQQMYVDLKREGKYTPSFSHLMRALLDVFFCNPGVVPRERRRQVLAKEVFVPLTARGTPDKVDLLQARRNKFLLTFFRNTFYIQSCAGDYIKDRLSRLFGPPPFGKHRVCRKDLEELASLVFCVGGWVDV